MSVLLTVVAGLLAACGEEPEPGSQAPAPARPALGPFSADAHPEATESLLEDLAAPRHASDGGGRAWLSEVLEMAPGGAFVPVARTDEGVPIVEAESRGRFHLVYEAGPLGVANSGVVFLQVSPFWEWDDPQTVWADASGYTEVSTDAEGVLLDAFLVAPQLKVGSPRAARHGFDRRGR